ncbi:MAG: type II toxin-antitoxin system VapC family toxin [Nanoarchaeota archaeon]
MNAIDANVFLELLLDQARADECDSLLKTVFTGKTQAVVSDFTIDGIIIAMARNRIDCRKIRLFLLGIQTYKGLKVYHHSLNDKIKATILMEKTGLDLEDSLTLQCAVSSGCKGIVSLDSDFAKVKEIKKIDPKQAMKN